MTHAIEIDSICKRYAGGIQALDNVSFAVEEGELFGLIGPDGAGKSTLYQILTTLLLPDAGSAKVNGFDIVSQYRDIRSSIGYMPEKFSLYQDLSVKENLEFFASLFGVTIEQNYDLIKPIFQQLAQFPNRRAGALSGGMKQKLALSCALIHRPKVLLLDEPTTGVDAISRSEFWDMLDTLRQQGISIMVSTSYMDEAQRCQRIALIDKGHILGVDTPEVLVAGYKYKLFNAVASRMYDLLEHLKTLPGVMNCYTFGATLHVVSDGTFDPDAAIKRLSAEGLKDVKIYPGKPDVEDLFISLMEKSDD